MSYLFKINIYKFLLLPGAMKPNPGIGGAPGTPGIGGAPGTGGAPGIGGGIGIPPSAPKSGDDGGRG